ncbi:MAG TPA: cytochrome c oxidase subunit II [Longimicrobiales bacterium]
MTDAFGRQAALIERLWWPTLWVLTAIYIAVMIALAYAMLRRRHVDEVKSEVRTARWVGAAIAGTVVILFAYFISDLFTARAIAGIERKDGVTIEVTGLQWWWRVEYSDSVPERRLTTANEIHIPVGRPVRIITSSADVIHSFWIRELHGKRDLIPGDKSEFWLRADSAGVFRGQCAEFCGLEHAKMALVVVAEPEAQFQAWYDRQLSAARVPPVAVTRADSLIRSGHDVFVTKACVMCHTIRGTTAGSSIGPDLTHLASRRMIAAGTRTNTRGNLAGWVVDPQGIKPGALMPPNNLTPAELEALISFLESLK